jgi:hypothetical protein
MQRSITEHFEEYQHQGYTVFKGYMTPELIGMVRQAVDREFHTRFTAKPEIHRTTIADILRHDILAPLMERHLLNAVLLDYAEQAMGPFVQLDSFEITGFPIRPIDDRHQVAEWHRDAFNYSDTWAGDTASKGFSTHPYTAPTACNSITYLQDMTEETGALRVVPGSHLDFTHIAPEDRHKPHPREACLTLSAGDMVFTHNELLHAGSINTSQDIRYFISIYFERIGLPHRDDFNHPRIDVIRATARQGNDRRVMRLFGEDPLFAVREQGAWQSMIDEDRRATH